MTGLSESTLRSGKGTEVVIERRVRFNYRQREALGGYLFILPWILGLVIFIAYPIVASLYYSFTDYQVVMDPVWIGTQNYERLIRDDFFWQAMKVTTIYVAVSVPLGLVLSFLVALLMNQNVKGIGFWRTIFYLPNLVPLVAGTMLWLWVFNPEFGLINGLLEQVGVEGPLWLRSQTWSLPSLIIMNLWSVGGATLIYLAGLQGIPSDLYDAVATDGGGAWAKFRTVTIPQMSPVIFYNLILGLIAGFQVFAQPLIMTGGGPRSSTLFVVLYLYYNAFRDFRMGYASAIAWVLFLVILVLTILMFRISRSWVYYEGERRA
jgi:multiple sugar transport system permease protein